MSKLTSEMRSEITLPASSLPDVLKVTDEGTAIIQNADLAKLIASELKVASAAEAPSAISIGIVAEGHTP
jgi:hypothetical protein